MFSENSAARRRWIVLFPVFVFSLVIYGVVAFLAHPATPDPGKPTGPGPLAWILPALAALLLVASVLSFPASLIAGAPRPQVFFRRTVVALALAEGSAVVGLAGVLLGACSLLHFAMAAVAAAAVMLLWVYPRGAVYWRLQEEQQRR